MRSTYPLFQSHLDLAHLYWSQLVKADDHVLDATCGNGYDTLKLCLLALNAGEGRVYAIDRQKKAIEQTQHYLAEHLTEGQLHRTTFFLGCHSQFPDSIQQSSLKLAVYNLGYLPGGDKRETTEVSTTLLSLKNSLPLIAPGGAISVTCYPGHPEGENEERAILEWAKTLPPFQWSCCHHQWLNRQKAPSLLLFQKADLKVQLL